MQLLFLYLFLFFACFDCHANTQSKQKIPSYTPKKISISIADLAHDIEKIDHILPPSFTIQNITYESDAYLARDEFFYLINIQEKSTVTTTEIKKAVYYLGKKNQFKHIVLEITATHNKDHYNLHFILKGRWIFSKLKCTGLLVGKDAYRQYYTMQPGEPFDMAKHNDACNNIEHAFLQQGYCDGKVISDLEKDEKTKRVTATLGLKQGTHYHIGTVTLKLTKKNQTCTTSPYNKIYGTTCGQDLEQLCKAIRSRYLNPLTGSGYSKALVLEKTKALHHYLAQKGFLQPTIELQEKIVRDEKKVNLIFNVHVQHKNYFAFTGNKYFSDTQLRNALLEFGSCACLLPAPILAQELEKMYHDKGFWHATIETYEASEQTTFEINEGTRATIKGVEFKGAHHFNPEQLAIDHFLSLVKHKYFDAAQLTQSLYSLRTFYMQQGFWQFTILKTDFIPYETKPHWYTLHITLDERQRTYLGTIHVSDYPEAAKYVFASYPFDSNDSKPFNLTLIQEQRKKLNEYFTNQGYSSIQLTPIYTQRTELNDQSSLILDVDWQVHIQKTEKKFGKTIIQNASTFNNEYIMRELAYKEKEKWDPSALKQTINNLKELSIFEHIHLQQDHCCPFEDEQPLLLHIQHDDPFEIRARAGFAFQQLSKQFAFGGVSYRAGGTFLYKNPFDRGDLIRANVEMSRSLRTVQLQYLMPWLFKWPVRTVMQGYTNKYVQPGTVDELKHIYDVTQQGFLLGTHRTWGVVQMGSTTGIEWNKTEPCDDCAVAEANVTNALNFAPQLVNKNIAYFMIEPSFYINYLDNQLEPTQGSLSVVSCKGMFPLSTIGIRAYLLKIMAEQSFFIPLFPVVIAIRGRIGHIFHEQFCTISPTERFYLGGAHSIRSYEADMAPPLGKIVDNHGQKSFVPQGGKSMFNINLEVRFPLYKRLGGVLFHDVGALSTSSFADIKAKDVVSGTGFGLRYNTPIGPLRFDIAFKWHRPDPCLARYAWFLTIGHAF